MAPTVYRSRRPTVVRECNHLESKVVIVTEYIIVNMLDWH